MKISAKIIAHSIANDIPLITAEWCYPRFIHSEVMTHRMFSRNASSSRAIPIEKVIKQVEENPAMPIHWGKNQPGMQSREELDPNCIDESLEEWHYASYNAINSAKVLNDLKIHKQVANRLLEPFQWIKVIVTATEWDNFFKLRLHPDAQPEIQELARCMKKAMDESTPVELKPGEWHLPYVKEEENLDNLTAISCSVARCARVSYQNHDMTVPDIEKDIALADKLLAAGHMSPFEHQATPMRWGANCGEEVFLPNLEIGVTHVDRNQDLWSGNLRGFIQYRQLL